MYINEVLEDDNIISIHVLYRVKSNEDGSPTLKAMIAHHVNADSLKRTMKQIVSFALQQ